MSGGLFNSPGWVRPTTREDATMTEIRRGRCPECGSTFDPPVSQCPNCAVGLQFPEPPMTTSDEWVRERARELLSSLDAPGEAYSLVDRGLDRTATVLQEAIERGKAEQNALSGMTVTLCGSTRFKAAYIDWFQRLTDQGLIVLTVGRYLPKKDHGSQLKADLDTLHFRKIDRSSRILVLDVGGYIGDSTRNEIAHAERTGKQVEYLSSLCPDYVEPPLAETDIGRAVAVEIFARLENPDEALLRALSEPPWPAPRRDPDGVRRFCRDLVKALTEGEQRWQRQDNNDVG